MQLLAYLIAKGVKEGMPPAAADAGRGHLQRPLQVEFRSRCSLALLGSQRPTGAWNLASSGGHRQAVAAPSPAIRRPPEAFLHLSRLAVSPGLTAGRAMPRLALIIRPYKLPP